MLILTIIFMMWLQDEPYTMKAEDKEKIYEGFCIELIEVSKIFYTYTYKIKQFFVLFYRLKQHYEYK